MITIEKKENKIYAVSPYNPSLPGEARKLGGKWSGSAWVFDSRDEDRVRELYRSVYGTDGSESGELVTVRIKIDEDFSGYCESYYCGPVQIARGFGRDSGVKLSDNVVLIDGRIFTCGSRKNWRVGVKDAVIEIRDIPRGVADAIVDDLDGEGCEILGDVKIDVDALEAEKAKLVERLAEIEKLLAR